MEFTTITLVVATLALMTAHNASCNAVSNAFRRERVDQAEHRSYHYSHGYAPHTCGRSYLGSDGYYGHGYGYLHHPYHGSHL